MDTDTPAGFIDVSASGIHSASIDALLTAGITTGCLFHDLIAEATGNASLRMLCASFSAQTQRSRLIRSRSGPDIGRS